MACYSPLGHCGPCEALRGSGEGGREGGKRTDHGERGGRVIDASGGKGGLAKGEIEGERQSVTPASTSPSSPPPTVTWAAEGAKFM